MGGELDDATVDRILRRAAELEPPERAALKGHSAESVMAAAKEAGLSPEAVRTAIAMEALGKDEHGQLERTGGLFGSGTLTRTVEVPGDPAAAMDLVDQWLRRAHRLRRRKTNDRSGEWIKRRDIVGRAARRVGAATGMGGLGAADAVRASVVAIPDTAPAPMSMVHIEVDRSGDHRKRMATGGALTGVGAAGTGVTLTGIYLTPVTSVGFIAVGAGGVATMMSGRGKAEHLEVELDRLTDQLERGTPPRRMSSKRYLRR